MIAAFICGSRFSGALYVYDLNYLLPLLINPQIPKKKKYSQDATRYDQENMSYWKGAASWTKCHSSEAREVQDRCEACEL